MTKPRWVVTASEDETARVWECELCTDVKGLLALADQRVSRDLTPDERRIYLHASPCWLSYGPLLYPPECVAPSPPGNSEPAKELVQ